MALRAAVSMNSPPSLSKNMITPFSHHQKPESTHFVRENISLQTSRCNKFLIKSYVMMLSSFLFCRRCVSVYAAPNRRLMDLPIC